MKNVKTVLIGVAIAAFGATSFVQAQVTHTFNPNEAASAAEVNTNFADLVADIAALSAEVDALQAAAPTNDVTGRTYTLLNMRSFFEDQRTATSGPGASPNLIFNNGSTEADITFNADGTVSVTGLFDSEFDVGWNTDTGVPNVGAFSAALDGDGTGAATYTQDGGFIDVPEFEIELYASKDGSILVFSVTESGIRDDNGATEFSSEIGLFVEIP